MDLIRNLPVNIRVVKLFVIGVLCEDVNQSEIIMANSKPAVRRPNVRPWNHGDIDEQHCGNINKDLNLQK